MHLKSEKRGDTLIEVVLAFAMFSLVAVVSIAVMNSSISGAEASLELSLARTEIDSQAEALRFIHAAFADNMTYSNLWYRIVEQKISSDQLPNLDATNCDDLYNSIDKNIYGAKAFIINPRKIVSGNIEGNSDYYRNTLIVADNSSVSAIKFQPAVLNPRVIYTGSDFNVDGTPITSDDVFSEDENPDLRYTKVSLVEGIYDMVMAGKAENTDKPPHYDFYIYTCWMPSGAKRPTTIGTVLRLFNPEFVDQ